MLKRNKSFTFILLFLLWWLLLLLLGDSFLEYALMGAGGLLFLFFSKECKWKQIGRYKEIFLLWLLLLTAFLASAFFSRSKPLSLHVVSRYFLAFISFWFFILIDKSFIKMKEFISLLILPCLMLVVFSIFFQIYDNTANLLPGMNLFYATYGHNHLAALLLIFLPFSWWWASDNYRKDQKLYWWLLPIIFTLSLLGSFGRVLIVLGLMQFGVVYLYFYKSGLLSKIKFLNLLFKFLFFLFVTSLISVIFLSSVSMINPDFKCPVPRFENQLCKSIAIESRPKYWEWALAIFKDYPVLGSGPGTFGMMVRGYRDNPSIFSAYAHNEFLHQAVEIGFIGVVIWTGLFIGLLITAIKRVDLTKWNQKTALLIGLIFLYINLFFDMDWNFLGIFIINLTLLALLIKESLNKKKASLTLNLNTLARLSYFLVSTLVIMLGGIYLFTEVLISQDKVNQSFDFFPYFHWHKKIYESYPNLTIDNKNQFYHIYQFHSEIYPILLLNIEDPVQKLDFQKKWLDVDPWAASGEEVIPIYLEQGKLHQASYWLDRVYQLWNINDHNGVSLTSFERKKILPEQMLNLGDRLYQAGEFELAGSWYLKSLWLDPWLLHKYQPIFAKLESVESDEKIIFFKQIFGLDDIVYLGKYQELYLHEYFDGIEQLALKGEIDTDAIKQLLSKVSWSKWFFKNDVAPLYLNTSIESLLASDYIKAESSLMGFIKLWSILLDYDQDLVWTEESGKIQDLQLLLDNLVETQDYDLAYLVVDVLTIISHNDYWVLSQQGNIAVLEKDISLAAESYQECIDTYKSLTNDLHKHCQSNLDLVLNGQLIADRYWGVSRIIRGEQQQQSLSY